MPWLVGASWCADGEGGPARPAVPGPGSSARTKLALLLLVAGLGQDGVGSSVLSRKLAASPPKGGRKVSHMLSGLLPLSSPDGASGGTQLRWARAEVATHQPVLRGSFSGRRKRKPGGAMAIRPSDALDDILHEFNNEPGEGGRSDEGNGHLVSGDGNRARAQAPKIKSARVLASQVKAGPAPHHPAVGIDKRTSYAARTLADLDDALDIVHEQGLQDSFCRTASAAANQSTPGMFVEYGGLSAAISALNARNSIRHAIEYGNSSDGSGTVVEQRRVGEGGASAGGRSEQLQIFAREVNSKGARVFAVSAPSEFYRAYRQLDYAAHSRHYYEMLLEVGWAVSSAPAASRGARL
jgi:hypothetical protein